MNEIKIHVCYKTRQRITSGLEMGYDWHELKVVEPNLKGGKGFTNT